MHHEGKVQYLLELPNGLISSVRSYEDLRDGVFEELAAFNRIPTEAQRQTWLAKGGPTLDMQMQEEHLRRRIEGDIPQKPVTADDVRQMIKQEQKQEETATATHVVDDTSSTTPKKKKSSK